MIVGVLRTQICLNGITSLKQKRSIVKSLLGRLKSRFNISISEVDHNDDKQSAVLAISLISNDKVHIDQQLDTILGFIHKDGRFYVGIVERETFNV